jgi:hypothetical protein
MNLEEITLGGLTAGDDVIKGQTRYDKWEGPFPLAMKKRKFIRVA